MNEDPKFNEAELCRNSSRFEAAFNSMSEAVLFGNSDRRLIAAIEAIQDAIAITETDGTILYVNPAFETVTGFPQSEVLGEKLPMLIRGSTSEAACDRLLQSLSLGVAWTERLKSVRRDGSDLIEDCSVFPIRNSGGAVVNFIAVAKDVTDKARLEAIAEDVNSMNTIGYVFSSVRHELGNPINALKTVMNVLALNADRYSRDELRNYLARMLGELAKIEALMKNFKSFAAFETPEIRPLDMSQFMDKLLNMVRKDFAKKGIEVTLRVASPSLRCLADPRALQQALMNVLVNSFDACGNRREGKIAVSVFGFYDRILIRIDDNCGGMTEEESLRIFKPFHTGKPGKAGLGLMLVKKMVSLMNGTVNITSDAGHGTTVDIFLPEAKY